MIFIAAGSLMTELQVSKKGPNRELNEFPCLMFFDNFAQNWIIALTKELNF